MIKPVGTHESSFAKKAAVAVGVAAVAAGTVYALKKGQLPDAFEGGKAKQVAARLGDGYKKLGGAILDTAKKGINKVKEKAPKVLDGLKEKFNNLKAKFTPVADDLIDDAVELGSDVIS